jgi:hypothetical protein
VVGGVGDRSGSADDADLADASGAHRAGVQVAFVEPDRVEVADIGIGGDVVAREVVV